jgi:predicted phage terminase large subunit-like protein
VPVDGNMIKREWLCYEDGALHPSSGQITLSLDTATKTDPIHDYSVCTVWLETEGKHHLIRVWRDKVDYPDLRNKVLDLMRVHHAQNLLIEDQGAGTSLIQELKKLGVPAIGRKTRDPKVARLAAASSYIEAGQMRLPKEASWLAEFEAELLGFPGARHDDQVDSLSQYFGWVRERPRSLFSYDMMQDDEPPTHDTLAEHLLWIRGLR